MQPKKMWQSFSNEEYCWGLESTMSYKPMFDPDDVKAKEPEIPPLPSREGDRHGLPVYVYNSEIKLALNVALATGRPLLVRGDPGCGKSTLARHVAYKL